MEEKDARKKQSAKVVRNGDPEGNPDTDYDQGQRQR